MTHHDRMWLALFLLTGEAILSLLLGPALSPWETTLPGVMGGTGNNPSLRLVEYDQTSGTILDIHQYWMNLTQSNLVETDNWQLEYKATEYYNIPDVSTKSLAELIHTMAEDDDVFSRYYKANGVLYDPNEKWDHETKAVHLCSIANMDYADYEQCMLETNASGGIKTNHVISVLSIFMVWVILS